MATGAEGCCPGSESTTSVASESKDKQVAMWTDTTYYAIDGTEGESFFLPRGDTPSRSGESTWRGGAKRVTCWAAFRLGPGENETATCLRAERAALAHSIRVQHKASYGS